VPGDPFTLEHFCNWARALILDSGEGWELEGFQKAFVTDVFDGISECWLVVPEGNGKSTLVAGLALYHIQHTISASVPTAAASRDQAELIYRQAEGFILRTEAIQGVFKCQPGYRRIICPTTGSRIQIFAADDRTGDGVIPTLCLIDELHRHRDLGLYRTWRGKLGKRNGQIVTISTAGEPGSQFEETRERIRQGAEDVQRQPGFIRAKSGRIVLHEWALPEGADVEDVRLVKQANPFSGITVDSLTEKLTSETMTMQHWRRFTCNLPTRGEDAAIEELEWEQAQVAEQIPEGQPVWLGLDLAWKWDTTAAVPLWVRDPDYRLLGPAAVLTPPRDGTSLDPYVVERALIEIHERNPIHTVVMDMSKGEQLAAWIEEELGAVVVDRTQSNSFAVVDYERFMQALRNGWLRHTGDADLSRHVLNAVARVLPYGDARFDRPVKSRGGQDQDRRVIDALTAASMVHTAATTDAKAFVLV
jgi:phage terminase large subunit-like protein